MKNIEELNATIEELEKRIKAISSAGATLAQIIAVRDSLEQVKVCLNNLTTAIKDEEDDASIAQLTALEQRVTTAETDITTLQTDLTTTQDDLETVWNNLASTNSVVGEHTTTLTNLQTAQTNLQTTQTNQASTITTNTTDISNLKTRMTTAENNISALTGGVDVSAIDERLNSLEGNQADEYLSKSKLTILLNINNQTGYSRIYSYKIDECDYVEEAFTLNYSTESTGTFNLKLLRNGSEVSNIDVNLTQYPTSYTIKREFNPTGNLQTYQFCINTTANIKFTELYTKILGKNPLIFDNDRDLKIECFNNKVYFTKYENNAIKVGSCSVDSFDLSNLTFSQISVSTGLNGRYAIFGPTIKYYAGKPQSTKDCFYYELVGNTTSYNFYNIDTHAFIEDGYSRNLVYSGIPTIGNFEFGAVFIIENYLPKYFYAYSPGSSKTTLSQLSNLLPGKFYFADLCRINYYILNESQMLSENNMKVVCVYEDNYVYLIVDKNVSAAIKIARAGKCQKGYVQSDGSVNIYITRHNHTYMYNVQQSNNNYNVSFIKKIENCDCVYELCNNKLIAHTTSGWQIIE